MRKILIVIVAIFMSSCGLRIASNSISGTENVSAYFFTGLLYASPEQIKDILNRIGNPRHYSIIKSSNEIEIIVWDKE